MVDQNDKKIDIIDLVFSITGERIPVDHGYALYAAVCRVLPGVHGAPWLGIHPLRGMHLLNDSLRLSPRATLRFRVPASQIPALLPLGGQVLDLKGAPLRVGVPSVFPLLPSPSLDARLVAIRLTDPPRKGDQSLDKQEMQKRFLQEAERQLAALPASAKVTICGSQTLRVRDQRILGWSLRLTELSDLDSLQIQSKGLGGRRALGCGIFTPTQGSK